MYGLTEANSKVFVLKLNRILKYMTITTFWLVQAKLLCRSKSFNKVSKFT